MDAPKYDSIEFSKTSRMLIHVIKTRLKNLSENKFDDERIITIMQRTMFDISQIVMEYFIHCRLDKENEINSSICLDQIFGELLKENLIQYYEFLTFKKPSKFKEFFDENKEHFLNNEIKPDNKFIVNFGPKMENLMRQAFTEATGDWVHVFKIILNDSKIFYFPFVFSSH